jgi:hypothetical protein
MSLFFPNFLYTLYETLKKYGRQRIHCHQHDERKDVEHEHQTQRTYDRFDTRSDTSSSPARWHCCAARSKFR